MKIKTAIATCALSLTLMGPYTAGAAEAGPADPCQSMNVVKLSAPIQVQNNPIQIISASAKSIHVCGFVGAPQSGNFFEFEYGPSCSASSLIPLTGQMTAGGSADNPPLSYSGPGTIFSVPAGNALCVQTEGALQLGGIVTYTQP